MFGGLSVPTMSKDLQKQLTGAVKRVSRTPDAKAFTAAGDAANKLVQSGSKAMADIAVFFYEEVRSTGLFNGEALYSLATLYFERFKETKEAEALDRALKTMAELERAVPNHPTASKQMREWEAAKSMVARTNKADGKADFRSQVASTDVARKQEVMSRMIRTVEDAREVLSFVDKDLATTPTDKQLWVKKGDIHKQIKDYGDARAAYEKAQQIDPHDFVVTMRLGETRMEEAKAALAKAEQGGGDATAARQELVRIEIEEYRRRIERQPTEMAHRFNLAQRLFQTAQIDQAAAELQQTVRDPRLKKPSHKLLGACFTKKGLYDLAVQQYDGFLKLTEDDSADEAKEVRYTRGRLHEQLGKKDLAMADYTRLVELDLGYKDAADRLRKLRGADEAAL
jgi:tetratricopeptide (TPR) repeat protein